MFETLIRLGLSHSPTTLYDLHRTVAALLQPPNQRERHYIYSYNSQQDLLYVRAPHPLLASTDWLSMAVPKAGDVISIAGVVHINTSVSRQRGRLRLRHEQDGPTVPLVPRTAEFIIRRRLQDVGELGDMSVMPGAALPFGKPGMGTFPISSQIVRANLQVHDARAVERLLSHGLGQAKAFGFGVLHWRSAA